MKPKIDLDYIGDSPTDSIGGSPVAKHLDLIADSAIVRYLGVSRMTIARWENDPDLRFPKCIKIKTRNYRSVRDLLAWRAHLARKAVRP
jgi:predicted DNA-binding transcriptional regulator AlpA